MIKCVLPVISSSYLFLCNGFSLKAAAWSLKQDSDCQGQDELFVPSASKLCSLLLTSGLSKSQVGDAESGSRSRSEASLPQSPLLTEMRALGCSPCGLCTGMTIVLIHLLLH